jgi:hypothetical protein
MAGTRRLTVVTALTVTGLLFSGGALKAFADEHGGGDRGGNRTDKQRHVERPRPQVVQVAPEAEHGRGNGAAQASVVNVAAPHQPSVTHADDGDKHRGGGGGGDDHRGPSVNAGPGHADDDDEDENEHERERTPTPTPSVTSTPTATPVVTMTPTATPVEEEDEDELITVINGVVFECQPTDNGQGRDHGRHLGQVKQEERDDEEVIVTTINGIQFICEAEEEDVEED